MSSAARWMEERMSRVPSALRAWLQAPRTDDPEGRVEFLAARGVAALDDAISRPGRDREAAFHLLAADAYLTWACEAAAEDDADPGERLADLVRQVASDSG